MDTLDRVPALIIDNAIDSISFKKIQEVAFDQNFEWEYEPVCRRIINYDPQYNWFLDSKTGNYTNKIIYKNTFRQMALSQNKILTEIGKLCEQALYQVAEKLNLKIKYIHRIRLGLILPNEDYKIINIPHIDSEKPHYAGLLYLTNNDGETVLYNEMYNLDRRINSFERHKQIICNGGFTVAEKIESRENRFIIFQGNRYHSSTSPTNIKERITVNYNFDIL